ncbi:MAG: ATP-binding protein [Vicinamibacterales bacterium]
MKLALRLETLLAVLVLCTVLPLALFSALLIQSARERQKEVTFRGNLDTARAVSGAIDQHIKSTTEALATLSAIKVFEENYVDGFGELAARLLEVRPSWAALLLADGDGKIVGSRGMSLATTRPATWAIAVATTGRPAVSPLLIDAETDRRSYVVAVPVLREQHVQLVLGVELEGETLKALLQPQAAASDDGVVELTDADLTIIGRSPEGPTTLGQRESQEFATATDGKPEGSWAGKRLDGTLVYSAFVRSDLTQWLVVMSRPRGELDRPLAHSYWALTTLGLGTLLFGVVSGTIVGRIVVRAARSTTAAAGALARGEPVRPPRSHIVELDQLSAGLLRAATILEKRIAERDEAGRQLALAVEDRQRALDAERASRVRSEEQEAYLSVTLRSIGDAVIVTDSEGRVTMMNRVAQAMTGYEEADATGRPVTEVCRLVDEQTGLSLEDVAARAIREGHVTDPGAHSVLVSRTGNATPVSDTAAPLLMPDGTAIGAVIVFRDVSVGRVMERQRAALLEQEQAARREAEALSRSKDEFVATISHELRTPLSAIVGWVRLLRSGVLDSGAQAHALEVVERNTNAQTQLVEDLLEMSRIITGRMRPEMRDVAMGSLVTAAAESVKPTVEAKRISLGVDVGSCPSLVSADPDRLQQVIWNLLVNAVKFTPVGGRVDVRLREEGDSVVLSVRDSGVGIAADQLSLVFDQFWQGGVPDRLSRGGLGIGLSLVKRLIELHGGDVTAESEGAGHGSTFTVRLPALRGAPPSLPAVDRTQSPADADFKPLLSGVRVLVVEDDEDTAELIATVLQHAGAEVMLAASIGEALRQTAELAEPPHLILSDVGLPDGSGYDLLQRLRRDDRYRHVPAIAVTAYSRMEDREQATAAGFEWHVGKPFEPQELLDQVAAVTGRR